MKIKNVLKKDSQKIILQGAFLKNTLGQWLDVLDRKSYSEVIMTKEQKKEFQKKTREMFDAFGFQNESLVLKKFNSNTNEFEVFVKSKNESYNACLRFGNMDFAPEFILSSDNFKKIYNSIPCDNGYFLFYYELMNHEKGNQISRYASSRNYSVQFENHSYRGSISFDYPENISYKSMLKENPYVNEKELDDFLINLDYPVSMLDVYEKLLTVIYIPKEKLNINVSVQSKTELLFQEEISTQKGEVQTMSVTRNRRIMSWDENNHSWSLKCGDFRVEKYNGKYGYSSGNHTEKDVMYSLSREEEIEMIKEEVFKTKEEVMQRLLLK